MGMVTAATIAATALRTGMGTNRMEATDRIIPVMVGTTRIEPTTITMLRAWSRTVITTITFLGTMICTVDIEGTVATTDTNAGRSLIAKNTWWQPRDQLVDLGIVGTAMPE